MASRPPSRADYVTEPGHNIDGLKRRVNAEVEACRAAGRIPDEDSAILTNAVQSYLFGVAYREFRKIFSDAEADEHAAGVACWVTRRALSEKHVRKWVLTDRRAQGSTFLYRCAMNGVRDVLRKTKKMAEFETVSLDALVVRKGGSDSTGETMRSEPAQREALTPEQHMMLRSEFTELDLAVMAGTITQADAAELMGVAVSTVNGRRKENLAKAARMLSR